MITCTRRVQFAAGHRVYGHESKCANLHGHNYVVLFEAEAPQLDDIGRVIDFSVLKQRLGGWIEKEWDHGFLFDCTDVDCATIFVGSTWKRFACPFNPTAENMAEFLLRIVSPELLNATGVRVVRVTVWETENCYATASL